MSSNFDVTCAVPRNGRTLKNFLNKLKTFDAAPEEINSIISVVQKSKKMSSTNMQEVLSDLGKIDPKIPKCFGIFVDRKRAERPYRIGFLSHEWKIGAHWVRVEGEEPHNGSSLIKLDEVDLTVVGLDELLSMTQYYLKDPTNVTKWGMYNYHLEKPTGIRVAGSASLTSFNKTLQCEIQDIVGFFLISKPGKHQSITLEKLSKSGQRVFVKGRYTGIVTAAYPGLKIVSVEDVEDAVMNAEKGSTGIEIVQSGSTLKRKGLLLHGAPLFLSESLYVVDYDRYRNNRAVQEVVQQLNPVGYFDDTRIHYFARWYFALEKNLGEAWVDKPLIASLFCEPDDADQGLRPYRLQTRHWRPHDNYKHEDALTHIKDAKSKLEKVYQNLIVTYADPENEKESL